MIAVADYERTIQQAFREVADLLAARDTLAEQLRAQEAAERAQDERLRIADARYNAGVSSYLDVLDAQREAYIAARARCRCAGPCFVRRGPALQGAGWRGRVGTGRQVLTGFRALTRPAHHVTFR